MTFIIVCVKKKPVYGEIIIGEMVLDWRSPICETPPLTRNVSVGH